MRFILRLLITAAALWVAVVLVPGIHYDGRPTTLLLVALVFGLVNAVIRPVLTVLSIPLLLITIGLFTFVLNALLFWIASGLAAMLGLGFYVSGFWASLFGALVVGFVSLVLSMFLPRQEAA